MDGTILGQGTFTSSFGANPNVGVASVSQGNPVIIQVPSAADWVKVYDYTRFGIVGNNAAYLNGVANANTAVEWYWQRGMPAGTALVKYYANAGAAVTGDLLLSGGFTIYDPTGQQAGSQPLLGSPVAVTAVTNATRPVVSTANTAGVFVGTVVRLSNTAQNDINGRDFVVGAVTAGVSFTLLTATNPLANAPGAVGGAGFYRIVTWPPLFYPARKNVVNITQSATAAQVSTSVEHSYTVGQAVRFNIPAVSGMVQLDTNNSNNYMYSTITSIVDAYNFIIDTNTLSFTAFTYPTIAQQPSSFPTVEPIGENTMVGLAANQNVFPQFQNQNVFPANGGVFADATVNTGYYGMILGSGGLGQILAATNLIGPAGSVAWSAGNVATGDVMYWVSGKAEFGGL